MPELPEDYAPTPLPPVVHVWGFSAYRRRFAPRFFPDSELVFVRDAAKVPVEGVLALWGSTPRPPDLAERVRVIRIEDGFLRSVGLGADLVRPQSWVIDSRGIYYDAHRPSDLEVRLQRGVDDAALMARAASLRQAITYSGITKYNLGGPEWKRPSTAGRVVLVVGQVESDASIARGAATVRTDLDLLNAARRDAPDADLLVYKPHPDVLAGLRSAGKRVDEAASLCDELVTDCSMATLLDAVDEVHVMTSLAGFEALLRGKQVTTHGMPFYAGWGLTTDRADWPQVAARRTRRLTLDELVAVTLISYPRYVSRATGLPATPELVLAELQAQRLQGSGTLPWWRRAGRPLLGLAARLRGQ